MQDLVSYLKATRTKQADLAKKIGVSRGYMSELAAGNKMPSLPVAFAIEDATDGAVPASCWRPIAKDASTPAPSDSPPTEDAA